MKRNKAEEICAGVHTLHDETVELANSVLFMKQKLEEARIAMQDEPLVIEYDNGGGQCGIRENPHYAAYEKLQSSYNKALRQLMDIIEKGKPVRKASNVMKELSVIAKEKAG